jgi:hypothetical protein
MQYSYEMFKTRKEPSERNSYRYLIDTPFYSVYTDGKKDFHMAKEDRPSLLERVAFFEKEIRKNPYPIYTAKGILVSRNPNNITAVSQILGLPEEMVYEIPNGKNKKLLGTSEILSRISFEDSLFQGYGALPSKDREEILRSNSTVMIGAINYLIEKGIFFLEPERILDTGDPEDAFPIYVDEEKLREEGISGRLSGEELLISFTGEDDLIGRDNFIDLYLPTREKSLSELCRIAFSPLPPKPAKAFFVYRESLKNYFYGLVRHFLDEYFFHRYGINRMLSLSVLDTDTGNYYTPYPYIASGARIPMLGKEYRSFVIRGDEVQEEIKPRRFCFRELDREKIRTGYDAVHLYFQNHKEKGFLPPLFLKMMGVPAKAFPFAEYFDFERGTADQFLACFEFLDTTLGYKDDYPVLLPDSDGLLVEGDKEEVSLLYLLDRLCQDNLFISSYSPFYEDPSHPFYLSGTTKDQALLDLLSGKTKAYRIGLEEMERRTIESQMTFQDLHLIQAFLITDDDNGTLKTVKAFFSYMAKGYDSFEAAKYTLADRNPGFDRKTFLAFIEGSFAFYLLKSKSLKIPALNTLSGFRGEEMFYDPTLPLPFVHRGRLFLGYSKTEDSPVYLDSRDRPAISNLLKIYDEYFAKMSAFLYPDLFRGRERILLFLSLSKIETRELFLGLPLGASDFTGKEGSEKEILYQDGISLFGREDHRKAVSLDRLLRRLAITSLSLRGGLYPLSQAGQPVRLFFAKDSLDERLAYAFKPDVIRAYFIDPNNQAGFTGLDEEAISSLLLLSDKALLKDFVPLLSSGPEEERNQGIYDNLALCYGAQVEYGFLVSLSQEYFHSEKRTSFFYELEKSPTKNVFLALGGIFDAYRYPSEKDFFLAEEDAPLLLSAINDAIGTTPAKIRKSGLYRQDVFCRVGLPLVLLENALVLFGKKKITKEDIASSFRFAKRPLGIKDYTPNGFFAAKKAVYGGFNEPSRVRHECLKDGFFVPNGSYLLLDAYSNLSSLTGDYQKAFDSIQDLAIVAEKNLLGDARDTLLPSPILFASKTDFFLRTLKEEKCITEVEAFLLKEGLSTIYRKDPRFLPKAINLLTFYQTKAFEEWVSGSLLSLPRFGYHKPKKSFFSFFVMLFCFFQCQQVVFLKSGRLLSDKKTDPDRK